MPPDEKSVDSRVAVAERTLADHDLEIGRMRQRLHKIEGDRQAIRHLTKTYEELARAIPAMARQAATEAVALALQQRDEAKEKGEKRLLQWAAIVIATVGALLSIYVQTKGAP